MGNTVRTSRVRGLPLKGTISVFIRKKDVVKVATEIIGRYMDDILRELDIPATRLVVAEGIEQGGVTGRYLAQYQGMLMFGGGVYIHEGSVMHIWPEAMLYKWYTETIRIRVPYTYKAFERIVVDTLAHELRHAHQHYHKVHIADMNRLVMFIKAYHDLDHEKDAHIWAKEYTNKVFN